MGDLGLRRRGLKPKAEHLFQIDIRTIHKEIPLREGQSLHISHPEATSGVNISLAWTFPNYGGQRPWFVCPSCHSRVAILYLYSQQFLCRSCHDITYSSRCEGIMDILLRKERRLLEKLGGHLFPKPRGMHLKTRIHLSTEYVKNSNKLNELLSEKVDRLSG